MLVTEHDMKNIYTVKAPISGHPREAEKVSTTGAGHLRNDSRKQPLAVTV